MRRDRLGRVAFTLLVFPIGVLHTMIAASLIALCGMVPPLQPLAFRIVWVWARLLLRLCRIEVCASGFDRIRPPSILVPLHQGFGDAIALVQSVPVPVRFVAKRELRRIPFVGSGLVGLRTIIIDRSRGQEALEKIVSQAKARPDLPVVIFPEGHRSPPGRIGFFHRGAFELSMKTGWPVVPIVAVGGWRLYPSRARLRDGTILTPGRIELHVLEPIFPPKEAVSWRAFAGEVRERLRARYQEITGEALEEIASPPPKVVQR